MPRTLVVLASLLWLPAAGSAQTNPPAPTGCPPVVVMARAVNKAGKVELTVDVPRPVIVEEMKVVEMKDGKGTKVVEVRTTVQKTVISAQTYVVDGKMVSVTRRNGADVDPRDLPFLLARSTAAVMFCGKADPYYTQVLRDDVLIIRVPEPMHTHFPAEKDFPKPPPKLMPKEKT